LESLIEWKQKNLDRFKKPYVDDKKIKEPAVNSYVLWLDMMGTQSNMLRSSKASTIFIMKLHVSALEAKQKYKSIEIYPVIDGIYVCSTNQGEIRGFVKDVLSRLAFAFIHEEKYIHKYMVRGCLTYGPIVKGSKLCDCSSILNKNDTYCNSIILGIPLSQAYREEKKASPFGIYLGESARAFAPGQSNSFVGTCLKWWDDADEDLVEALKAELDNYLDWCKNHLGNLEYPKDSWETHKRLSDEYFSKDYWSNV